MNPQDTQLTSLINEFGNLKEIEAPSWAKFVKTGHSKERVPEEENWWTIRAAGVLRKVQKYQPVGTNTLSKKYGGRKNRGVRPEKKCNGSRNIIRKILQQLEKSELIKSQKAPKAGKILTAKGKLLLNKTGDNK